MAVDVQIEFNENCATAILAQCSVSYKTGPKRLPHAGWRQFSGAYSHGVGISCVCGMANPCRAARPFADMETVQDKGGHSCGGTAYRGFGSYHRRAARSAACDDRCPKRPLWRVLSFAQQPSIWVGLGGVWGTNGGRGGLYLHSVPDMFQSSAASCRRRLAVVMHVFVPILIVPR